MSPSAPNCFNLCAHPWGKSCKFVGSTRGANMFSIMAIGFWFEEETGDVAGVEDKTKGTSLLELATMLFWADTEETNFYNLGIKSLFLFVKENPMDLNLLIFQDFVTSF